MQHVSTAPPHQFHQVTLVGSVMPMVLVGAPWYFWRNVKRGVRDHMVAKGVKEVADVKQPLTGAFLHHLPK
jgi:hypothetical protein